MRWEALFDDMEAQLAAAEAAEMAAQVSDLTRAERATVPLAARLRAAAHQPLSVRLRGGELVSGTVVDVADQWFLLADGARRTLVPAAAVAGLTGLPVATRPEVGAVGRRLGLGHVLRALARDRVVVRVLTEGDEVTGRVERVGADHLDVAVVMDSSGARSPAAVWTVPFAALLAVRSG